MPPPRVPTDPGYPHPASVATSALMRGNRRANTRPEVALRSALHRMGLRFRKDHMVRAGDVRVKVDVAFTRRRVVVQVDGCFWHGCPVHGRVPRRNAQYWPAKIERNRARDRRVNEALRAEGWAVLRIWEHVELEEAVRQVVAALADAEGGQATGRRSGRPEVSSHETAASTPPLKGAARPVS